MLTTPFPTILLSVTIETPPNDSILFLLICIFMYCNNKSLAEIRGILSGQFVISHPNFENLLFGVKLQISL